MQNGRLLSLSRAFLLLSSWAWMPNFSVIFDRVPCTCSSAAIYMIIKYCATLCMMEQCCQMQIKHTMSTHEVVSQLLLPSYIPPSQSDIFPHSGIKFSCLTKADPSRFFLSYSQPTQPACHLCSFCPHSLVINRPWEQANPTGMKKILIFFLVSKLFLNKVGSLLDF